MSGSQQEFAKALSLVTRVTDDRVAATSSSPIPRGNNNNNNNIINGLIGKASWHSTAAALDYHQFTTPGISPPNSEDIDNSLYDEGDDDFFGSSGFSDEAITDRLGRLRHLQRMSRKGKRQPNWSEAENNILVEQFEKYKEVLKPKRSEGVSARDKKEAWESICAAVNESNAAALKRSAKDVRKKWENIRTWARKVITEWKHECSQTLKTGKTECPPADPPELARRIMVIYDFDGIDDDGHDYDDEIDPSQSGEIKYTPLRAHPDHIKPEDSDETLMSPKSSSTKYHRIRHASAEENRLNNHTTKRPIKDEQLSSSSRPGSRSASTTPPSHEATPIAHATVPIAPPLNVPFSRRYHHRDSLLDYRLLDAARIQERFQQHSSLLSAGGDGNSSSIAPSTSPSPPPPKKPRHHSRCEDETKDIRELQREVLILQKEKLVMEKEKIQMEKEKLRIEKENLMLERHRMMSSPHVLLPMMS